MNDDDIYAFTPAPTPALAPAAQSPRAARKRPVWPWLLLGAALLLALWVVAGAAALLELVQSSDEGLDIAVNGGPWAFLHADPDLGFFSVLVLVVALLVVLPLVLILALLAVALSVGLALLAVVGAVALAACCVLLVVALALSPLWGVLLLLWLVLRPHPDPVTGLGAA